jgi:hypothetical protein
VIMTAGIIHCGVCIFLSGYGKLYLRVTTPEEFEEGDIYCGRLNV